MFSQAPYPRIWDPCPPAPPPDLQWRRACDLAADKQRHLSRKRDSNLLIRAVQYLRATTRCASERSQRALAAKFPDIFVAFKLGEEPGLRPWEVKARVLARQSDRAIARYVGSPTPAVAAFLGLFFNVRPYLDAHSYINQCVLGLRASETPTAEALGLATAYNHGPRVIEAWRDFLQHPGETQDLRTEAGRTRASLQLLVDVHSLELNDANRRSLLRMSHLILNSATKTSKPTSLESRVCKNLSVMEGEIAWKEPAVALNSERDAKHIRPQHSYSDHFREKAQVG